MGKAKAKSKPLKPSVDNAKDAYEIAKDAVEDAAGREPKRHKALIAEAGKLTRMGYQKDPTVRVPAQLRDFVKFTEATIRREFMATSTDADGAKAGDLTIVIRDEGVNATVEYGMQEYMVWRVESDAEAYGRECVLQDLKDNPEYFNQSFIEGHIDMKELAKLVEQDAKEDGYIDDLDRSDMRMLAKQYNIDMEDDEGEDRDEDEVREEIREAYATEMAKDPMQRMEDMLGKEEAVKWAIEHAGIDYESAVDQAIRDDGWIHFVNSYGGDYTESPVLDYVIYRTN